MNDAVDVAVVGAGPNGLAAAVVLAERGLSVHVLEANDRIGGAARTDELTLPGFRHDLGSAVHPLGVGSPLFRTLPLEEHGLEWVHPDVPVAHPLPGRSAAAAFRSLDETAQALGADGARYARLLRPLVSRWADVAPEILRPLVHLPRHPFLLARFGAPALLPATTLARTLFAEPPARALFAGIAAHANMPLTAPASSAIGLMLGAAAHAVGWPVPKGGAQSIADALGSYVRTLGGTITTGRRITRLEEVPPARAVLFDLTPRQLLRIASDRLPAGYRRQLERYRYGPAVFKVDYALSAPIPWRDEGCRRAGTLHLGGTLGELAAAEAEASAGRLPERPFVLLAQPSLFDPTRAPEGRHTAWAYAHVPYGYTGDATALIDAQVERFAPGFRDIVLARASAGARELERQNANLVGGDINGGRFSLRQLLARPIASPVPYRVPTTGGPRLYLCSSSTPPGGGVHGMCGYWAAQTALRDLGVGEAGPLWRQPLRVGEIAEREE